MKRLIVCDIDNTLLPAGGKISDTTAKVLSELDSDTGFSIATGRSFHVVRKFVRDFDLNVPVITSNGAQLYDYQNERSVFASLIPVRSAKRLVSKLIRLGYDFVAYADRGIYYRTGSSHLAFFNDYNRSVPPDLRAVMLPLDEEYLDQNSWNITKILVYSPSSELIRDLKRWKSLEITSSMNHVIDIMASGATKGAAVVALAKYLNVPLSQVYCFGDNENDVSMFTCGAIGIAMGNASESVQKQAAMVTRTCLEDGVAWAITNLILRSGK
ncbi:MAG: HAD family hydrolase [Clostridiales bacterium]|nr:HAD family hydrolase [Clostridiales bacterium]